MNPSPIGFTHILHSDPPTELYGDEAGPVSPVTLGHQQQLGGRQGGERLGGEAVGHVRTRLGAGVIG